MTLQPEGGGTRLAQRVERLSAPLWVQLIQPWLLWPLMGRSQLQRGLANIKARVEAGRGAAGQAPTTAS